MTRKSRKYQSDSDEELIAAEEDPNAIIYYNRDGTFRIEYIEDNNATKIDHKDDKSDQLFDVWESLGAFCRDRGLFLLDNTRFSDFCQLFEK